MTLESGILGYLVMRPLSGYDIKKLFDATATYFWSADQAQIYRSLKKMAEAGLVKLEKTEQGQTVNRKIYAITPQGREELRRQIISARPEDFISRSPHTMQLFFSGALSHEEQLDFINTHIKFNEELLRALKTNYEKIAKAYTDVGGFTKTDSRFVSANYVYRWGVIRSKAYGDFLKEIKSELLVNNTQ